MGTSTDAILVYGFELGEEEGSDMWEQSELLWDRKDGVRLIDHCSRECPMWILGIEVTEIRAWRGEPKMVDPQKLVFRPEWDRAIITVAEELGLKVDTDRLGWWLASNWS